MLESMTALSNILMQIVSNALYCMQKVNHISRISIVFLTEIHYNTYLWLWILTSDEACICGNNY